MPATLTELHWDEANEAVHRAKRILIATHVKPDGDAIGSMVGLGNALSEMGKSVDMCVDDGVPVVFKFIENTNRVYSKIDSGKYDLFISVDSSDEERTGAAGVFGRANSDKVINLDHHPTNTLFGDIHLVMSEAVSATEIVYHWLKEMNASRLSQEIAQPLLLGLVTDTLGFRTSNVKSETLGIAQSLMEAGASLTEITARTLDSMPFHGLQLWSKALHSVHLEDQIISATVLQEDLKSIKLTDVTDSGLVGLLNQINEARVAVIFWEGNDDTVKLSMRSKRGYDVGAVAAELGGGGHTQASGATLHCSVQDAREKVMPMLRHAVESGQLIIE